MRNREPRPAMGARDLQPATRADWLELAKVACLTDLAMVLGLRVCMTFGGHA